jgi:hypothetical protein
MQLSSYSDLGLNPVTSGKNTPWYRVLFGDNFESLVFFLQLLITVVLDRRLRRFPLLNHLSSSYILTSHKGRCMSQVISMHRPEENSRQRRRGSTQYVPNIKKPFALPFRKVRILRKMRSFAFI